MKCFEKLILKCIKNCPLHLENAGTSVKMLFVDFSLTFNTIFPDILIAKLVNSDFRLRYMHMDEKLSH